MPRAGIEKWVSGQLLRNDGTTKSNSKVELQGEEGCRVGRLRNKPARTTVPLLGNLPCLDVRSEIDINKASDETQRQRLRERILVCSGSPQ
jgi:hypothetical protein